jgi:hypothetical protein
LSLKDEKISYLEGKLDHLDQELSYVSKVQTQAENRKIYMLENDLHSYKTELSKAVRDNQELA